MQTMQYIDVPTWIVQSADISFTAMWNAATEITKYNYHNEDNYKNTVSWCAAELGLLVDSFYDCIHR